MYESCFVVNCQDFDIMQVTTSRTLEPKPFLSSEKESLFLPKEMSALHVDHTTYYYTEDETLLGRVNISRKTVKPFFCVSRIELKFHFTFVS